MKIVCDNCATKYSIADEKVRGKVFKIRCKKCSHIIVVRGGADGSVEAAQKEPQADAGFPGEDAQTIAARGTPAAGVPSGDSVWHLVIDREQVGPMSVAEVRAKFAGGQIDAETFAWREGFGDWLRLASIDEFRDLGGAAPSARDSADLFASAPSESAPMGASGDGDVFGGAPANNAYAASSGGEADVFGGGGGLFSAPSAAPVAERRARTSSPGFAAVSASAADPGMGPPAVEAKPMTGQRNESSVLFSLNNLQALASGSGAQKSAPAASAAAHESRPGFASSQTEGSGLIDIRAMAASTLGAPSSGASSSGRLDDLPAMNAAPVFTPMAAPILMPAAASGPPKWIWAVLGTGVFALVGIVILGVMLWTRKPEPAPAPVVAAPAAAAPGTAAAPAAAAPGTPAAAPAAAAAAAAPAAPEEKKSASKSKSSKSSSSKSAKNDGLPSLGGSKPEAAAPPAAAPVAKKASKHDALDDLLNEGAPDKPSKKAARDEDSAPSGGGGDESLPEQLDKSAIVSGMGRVSGRVRGCFDQYRVPGIANVAMVIATSGRVSNANVTGQFAGTPTGDCVSKAVKSASFPRHKGAPQSIVYPYVFK